MADGVAREGVMPLEERTIVDIREEMALAALGAGATVTEVAMRLG